MDSFRYFGIRYKGIGYKGIKYKGIRCKCQGFAHIPCTLYLIIFLSVLTLSSISTAQQIDSTKIYKMSEIVVTATRTMIPEVEAASSISVIDSSEIAHRQGSTVFGLLKDQYGLSYTQQGAPGSLSNIYIRGGDPGETLILIDGVDMNMPNDPDNTFDFADLPLDNIKRIEILRGPQSTLYGSNAMAGVINIITKQGSGKPKFYLTTEGGSYDSFKGLVGLNGSLNNFHYSVTASRYYTAGFSSASSKYGNTEKDGTSNFNVSSRFGFGITNNFTLNLFLMYAKANTALDQHGGALGDDPTYEYHLEEPSAKVEGKLNLFNGLWDQTFGTSFFRNVREYSFDSTLNNPASSSSIYDGNRIQFDWQNNFAITKSNLLTFGIESATENAVSNYFYNSSSYGSMASIFPNKNENTTGAYLQDITDINNELFFSAGIRLDKNSRFGSIFTYRIAPAYFIWATGTKIKATIGTGFKSPSLFYLFDPAYGNPDLQPEKSLGWDAGIEQYLISSKLTAGINYFSNKFTNLFGFDNNFKTININKAATNGVEVYLRTNPLGNLGLRLNYTYTNSKDESSNSAGSGLPLLRRPKNKIGMNVDYSFLKDFNFNADIIYVGKRDDENYNAYPAQRIILPDYTIVNLDASYRLSDIIKIYGRVDNLFNKYYEEVYGYATPGLSGYLGINFTL